MTKYAALLRGINVGGNNIIKMAELKTCFEGLGLSSVLTYINSGNVIFSSNDQDEKQLVATIEKGIVSAFGLEIKTLVRSYENIQTVCGAIPKEWQNNTEQKTDVMFLWDEVDSLDTLNQISANKAIDSLIYVSGAMIWHVDRNNYSKSKMHDFIKNPLYKKVTIRNCNTVRKLDELMSSIGV